jgi:hypothetical protein
MGFGTMLKTGINVNAKYDAATVYWVYTRKQVKKGTATFLLSCLFELPLVLSPFLFFSSASPVARFPHSQMLVHHSGAGHQHRYPLLSPEIKQSLTAGRRSVERAV